LADKHIGSSALAALIAETETAIAAADQAAEAEREKPDIRGDGLTEASDPKGRG
jgi:hypothetical protein